MEDYPSGVINFYSDYGAEEEDKYSGNSLAGQQGEYSDYGDYLLQQQKYSDSDYLVQQQPTDSADEQVHQQKYSDHPDYLVASGGRGEEGEEEGDQGLEERQDAALGELTETAFLIQKTRPQVLGIGQERKV